MLLFSCDQSIQCFNCLPIITKRGFKYYKSLTLIKYLLNFEKIYCLIFNKPCLSNQNALVRNIFNFSNFKIKYFID